MTKTREVDFHVLFDKAPSLFLVLDPGFTIRAVSDAYLAATLTKRDEIVGHHLFEVFPDNPEDDDADGVGNLSASLTRVLHQRVSDTMSVQKYDIPDPSNPDHFKQKYWSCTNNPVLGPTGQVELIIHRAEDVTDFVELQERGGAQEAEILRRSAELRTKNRQLHAASEAKNEFLSRMSHELRTPLSAILGFSELLTMAELDPSHHDWSSMILRAGRHLLDLVNDVLDISRIESGDLGMSVEPIAVQPLLKEAYELVEPQADHRGITLHPAVMAPGVGYAIADAQRLRQVVVNLLSNAVKYNREGGDIRVSVEPGDHGVLRIGVTDTGPGLDSGALARLFVPFERLEAAAGIDGVGLGLALSRGLVDSMGGRLLATSIPGEGSTFSVELARGEPVAVEDIAAEQHAVLTPTAYAHDRTIVYIEDTAANLRLVEEILRARTSVRVLPAMLGSLGVELAQEHVPDLVLLDLHLPDIGGDEVLDRLRADERTRHIPVVILSADATGRAVEPLRRSGAHAFLTKPIGVRDLLAVVDELLGDDADGDAAAGHD